MKRFLYGSALTVLRLGFSSARRVSLPPLPLDFSSEVIQAKTIFLIIFLITGDHKGVKVQPGSNKK